MSSYDSVNMEEMKWLKDGRARYSGKMMLTGGNAGCITIWMRIRCCPDV